MVRRDPGGRRIACPLLAPKHPAANRNCRLDAIWLDQSITFFTPRILS